MKPERVKRSLTIGLVVISLPSFVVDSDLGFSKDHKKTITPSIYHENCAVITRIKDLKALKFSMFATMEFYI